MTPICITGADAPALHHLAQALQGAGVAPAQPLQRDAALDLHVWHQRVCQSGALPVVPSRLWEQVAIDLLLSNIDQPVWSWANARSIDALDFWAQLDTNIRFVLLCQTPQQAVAELFAANTGTEADEAHQLALWQQRHQALLRFHLRHPERSVLVWADQARQAPHVLAAHVAQQWQLPLQPDAVIATAQPLPHNAVQLQLAAQLVARHPQHQELERELHASVQPLLAAEANPAQGQPAAPTAQLLVQHYLQLADRSAEQAALQQKQQEADNLLQELHRVQELLAQQLEQYQAEQAAKSEAIHQRNLIAQAHNDVQAQLDAATRAQQAEAAAKAALQKTQADQQAKLDALTQTHAKTVADLQEAQQEGELLLQQLHQVQEELEKYYLNHQAAQAEVQQLKAQLHATEEERNQAVHQRNLTAQDRLNVLDQLKAADQAKTALQAQLDALAEEQAQLVKARDVALTEVAQERNEAVHQRNLIAQARLELVDELQATQQELERITQQLFQVQAELEQQHQREHAAQQLSQSLQARWSRLLEQQPELSDFDVVQLVGPVADGQPLQWQLNHTTVAGRAFEQLDFQTVLENGVAGFVWQRHPSNGNSPLARWPVSARSDDSVTLIPTKSATDTHKRAAHMVQLASSDWELLLALPAVLMQALERGRVTLPAGQRDLWHTALARSAELMRGMQRLVRFDAAELTAQQATPQREVLALRLAPLQFATTRLPELTFQLQLNKAADGGVTSAHFILDAAAQGTALQNWVANVPTATGQAVMALRLDAAGWDAALWQQLTDQDRTFMSALLDSLAVVLVTLQAAGARAERAWADWLKLATRLRQWARATPAPLVATEEPAPAPAPAEMLQAPEAPPAAAPARPRRSSSAKPKAAPAPATRTTTTRKKRAAQP